MSYTKFLIPLFSVICFVVGRYSVPDDSLSHDANIVTKATDSRSLKKASANAAERLNRTDLWEKASFSSSIKTTGEVRTNQIPALNEECQQLLSLLKFIDSWNFQPVPGRKRPSPYLVSLTTNFNSFDDREDELYQKLEESYTRIETARQRFQADPSSENEVMLTCWLLLHGEFLTLAPIHRIAGSHVAFEEGEKHLESIGKWEQGQLELLQQNHPAALFLLGTIKARNHVFLVTFKESTNRLVSENEEKAKLLNKYRSILQTMLKANGALYLGDRELAKKQFELATNQAEEIQKQVAAFDPERQPFLFANEPKPEEENPESLKFIAETKLSAIIPTIASLAHLQLLQKDRSNPQENLEELRNILTSMEALATKENPMGYYVRGLVKEEVTSLLLKRLLEMPQNANAAILQQINTTREDAVEALKQAQSLISFIELDQNALVSLSGEDSMRLALLAIKPIPQKHLALKTIHTSLERLEQPEKMHFEIYSDLNTAQQESAWNKAEQFLLLHGTSSQAWRDYIQTGIRTRQNQNLLKKNFQLARELGLFATQRWQEELLAGRIALYSGKEILGGDQDFMKSYLSRGQDQEIEENEKTRKASSLLKDAIVHFDEALEILDGKEDEIDYLLVRSLRAQAGALHILIRNSDAILEHVKYLRDAEYCFKQITSWKNPVNDPHNTVVNIDLLEAMARVHQARGILLLLEGEPERSDVVLAAFAKADEAVGRLRFQGGIVEQSSFLLSAILQRDPPQNSGGSKEDARMRVVLQMLVEGMVLGDLGNPESGSKRIDQANSELNRKGGTNSAKKLPSSHIWDLLFVDFDTVTSDTADKIVRLTSLLLQLEQSATTHSRSIGDIQTPSPVEANATLSSVIKLLEGNLSKNAVLDIQQLLSKTRKPVESLAVALAAESKARSLGFTEPELRTKWIQLAKAAVERSNLLQIEDKASFNVKYPLLANIRREMSQRFDSSASFLQRSKLAASRFRFDEAEQRYRDGIIHHPQDQQLWSELSSLLLTRLEIDSFSEELNKQETARLNHSLEKILNAWSVHRPEDRWGQSLLQARLMVLQENYDEAIDTLEAARLTIPSENKKAKAIINSKLAELVSSRQIRRISVPVQQEITSITTSQINHKE